jgi:hypothetical protein
MGTAFDFCNQLKGSNCEQKGEAIFWCSEANLKIDIKIKKWKFLIRQEQNILNGREQYENYMESYFPQINKFPFRHGGKVPWIRFELGVPGEWRINRAEYLDTVYKKAITVFENSHEPEDDIFLLVVNYGSSHKKNRYKKVKVFDRYIKDKNLRRKMHVVKTNWYDSDYDEEQVTYSYLLKCRYTELHYRQLLKAIAHTDFLIHPYISNQCFFINTTKHTIYHMYDDRGLDLVGESKESIKDIYNSFSNWVLDYDRKAIDESFESGLHGIEETAEERKIRESIDEEKLAELESLNISFELPHKPQHKFRVKEKIEIVEMVVVHLQRMGYATLVQPKKSITEDYSIICTKTCQLYQHQVSIQTSLMASVAKKYGAKYEGWVL